MSAGKAFNRDKSQQQMMANSNLPGRNLKQYITDKRLVDLRGIKSDTDQVSALVHMCKQAFQLEPTFDWEELPGQSRFKFKANVKFHGTSICCCRGQNKAEAKKAGAKLALHRVAPKLYIDLF